MAWESVSLKIQVRKSIILTHEICLQEAPFGLIKVKEKKIGQGFYFLLWILLFFQVAEKSHNTFPVKKKKKRNPTADHKCSLIQGIREQILVTDDNSEQENQLWFYEFLLLLRVD